MSDFDGTPLSPRATILRGVSPDALAIGYSDADRRWVTAAESGSAFDPLPSLDGALVVGESGLAAAADDFGHLVHHRPSAVLRPGSRHDVASIVRFAGGHGLKVAARGQGHSLLGQSQVDGGVQVDMSPLANVGEVRGQRVEVEAGATWTAVLRATLPGASRHRS